MPVTVSPPPPTVRRALHLLHVAAPLGMVVVVAALLAWTHLDELGPTYRQALGEAGYVSDLVTDVLDGPIASLRYAVAFGIAAALGSLLLGLVVRQRRPWARTVSWIGLAFLLVGAVGALVEVPVVPMPQGLSGSLTRVQALQADLVPVWYVAVYAVAVTAFMAALVLAAWNVLRTESADYFCG